MMRERVAQNNPARSLYLSIHQVIAALDLVSYPAMVRGTYSPQQVKESHGRLPLPERSIGRVIAGEGIGSVQPRFYGR